MKYPGYGKGWNVPKTFEQDPGKSFTIWAGGLSGVKFAACIEFPYSQSQM